MDVFISHSSHDKPIADAACAALESAGLTCWIAPPNITPGADWSAAIIEGIESSRLFVLVFTDHANRSPHVLREVERAVAKGIPIVPFRVENLAPTKGLEFFISSQHWLDAFPPPMEQHVARLTETAAFLLKDDSSTSIGKDHSTAAERSFRSRGMRVPFLLTFIAVSAIALVGGVGSWIVFSWLSDVKSPETMFPKARSTAPTSEVNSPDPLFVRTMKERFQRWDDDRDGELSVAEIRRGLNNWKDAPKEVAPTLWRLDGNQDNRISEAEFMELARDIVKHRDRDGDGRYTLGESEISHRAGGGDESVATIRSAFDSTDIDQDGYVTVPEVERSLTKLLLSSD